MDGLDAFVELSNKLILGEKVLQLADLVLALPVPGGLGHQRAGAWLLGYSCQPGLSQDHRMGQAPRDHRGHLVQPLCLAGLSWRTWYRIVSRQLFSISCERDSAPSLDNLFR